MLNVGDAFPEFSLPDQDGRTVTLSDLRGKRSIIYFYPKDDTPGCTLEACEFRDHLHSIDGASVFGVSPDSVKKHRKFIEKFKLNFPLLADEDKSLITAAGLWVEKTLYGKAYMGVERTTFLLDETGRIEHVWRKVKPEGHAEAVAKALK